MTDDRRFFITDRPGFTPYISRLVSMMTYARQTTLDAVRNLSIAQLDERPAGFGNSISALLEHFAAIEIFGVGQAVPGDGLDFLEQRQDVEAFRHVWDRIVF